MKEILKSKRTGSLIIFMVTFIILEGSIFSQYVSQNIAPSDNPVQVTTDLNAVMQQQINVTGTITDVSTGEPMPGVNIQVKGTAIGGISNSDGKYSLSVPDKNAILIFSFIGYKTQEIPLDGRVTLNVALTSEVLGLEEVVVIGYGTQSREVMTTSVSKLNIAVLANIPFANVASSIVGNLAGVRAENVSGMPGSTPRIIIRGGTSINNPNGASPIYVVDGVIRDNLDAINTMDVESIQVLKDASSTAIYGARGSNGVVIVTTKSGKAGPTQVTYDYKLTVSREIRKYDLLNSKEFVYYQRLGMLDLAYYAPQYLSIMNGNQYIGGIGNDLTNKTWDSLQPLTPQNEYKLQEGWQSLIDPADSSRTLIFSETDWQDVCFKTAISHDHSLLVSGGNENATFNLGLGYLDAEGVYQNTNYKRITMNLNGNIKISDKINVFGRIAFANEKDFNVPDEYFWFKQYLLLPPTVKHFFEDGSPGTGQSIDYANPEYFLSTYDPNNNRNKITLILGGQWKIFKGLTFDPQISLYQATSNSRLFQKSYWNGPLNFVNQRAAQGSFSKKFNPQVEGVFTYLKSINDVHNIEVKAGFSYYENNNFSIGAKGQGAATDNISTLNASSTPTMVTGDESRMVIMGYFSRVNYNYKEKYLFNASLRYDGASNLGTDHKWGAFPGISLGWNMHNEDFWKNLLPEGLLKLKLRTSYGVELVKLLKSETILPKY